MLPIRVSEEDQVPIAVDAFKTQWGLQPATMASARERSEVPGERGLAVFPIKSMWGSRVTRIYSDDGDNYILKKPVRYHPNEATDASCRFSNFVADELSAFHQHMVGGGVSTLRFLKRIEQGNSSADASMQHLYQVPGMLTEAWNHDVPLRYVCSKYIPGTTDLDKAISSGLLTRRSARFHMARALGTLHSFAGQARNGVANGGLGTINPAIPFLGSVASRLQKPLDRLAAPTDDVKHLADLLQLPGSDRVVLELQSILDKGIGSRFAELPLFPSTCDLQTKNYIISYTSGTVTVINTEILMLTARLWDLIYLLVLDDPCSGVFGPLGAMTNLGDEDLEIDPMMIRDFAAAIGVYCAHLKEDSLRITAEEAELFPHAVAIKLSQIAVMKVEGHELSARRCFQLVKIIPQLRSVLTAVLIDTGRGIPRCNQLLTWEPPVVVSSVCSPKTAADRQPFNFGGFRPCFDRIISGNSAKKTKALVVLPSSFMAVCASDFCAVVEALESFERQHSDVEIVGIAMAPTSGMESAGTSSTLSNRVSMLDLLLHCTSPADGQVHHDAGKMSFRNFNAFLDTETALGRDEEGELPRDSIECASTAVYGIGRRFASTIEAVNDFKAGSTHHPTYCSILVVLTGGLSTIDDKVHLDAVVRAAGVRGFSGEVKAVELDRREISVEHPLHAPRSLFKVVGVGSAAWLGYRSGL